MARIAKPEHLDIRKRQVEVARIVMEAHAWSRIPVTALNKELLKQGLPTVRGSGAEKLMNEAAIADHPSTASST
ncbi:hypothetical protein [Methyloceanibacter sp.]|uniref:hypothetical protein n=1 Tax=Methyloceanibacter sp. TaxID=1965321 RepID=UPI003D6D5D72